MQAVVTSGALPAGAFNLVHARLLLEHLPQRDEVLRALVRALRLGGWLLVEDFDWAPRWSPIRLHTLTHA